MSEKEKDPLLWNQFARLGEMIGDGLHLEPDGKWISKEYKRLSKILVEPCPELKDLAKQKNKALDLKILELIKKHGPCKQCGSELKQNRSGSKKITCTRCKQTYKAK